MFANGTDIFKDGINRGLGQVETFELWELTAGVVRRPCRLELVVGGALSLWSDPPVFGSPTAVDAYIYVLKRGFFRSALAQLPQDVVPKVHTRCSIEKFYGT